MIVLGTKLNPWVTIINKMQDEIHSDETFAVLTLTVKISVISWGLSHV